MKAPSESTLRLAFKLLVTPAAAALRLVGVDLMGLKTDPRAKTYWKTRKGPKSRVDMTSAS